MAQVTSTLIIECGVAATRAALIVDDIVRKLWFGPARGDEQKDAFPCAGRRFAGRVKSVNHSLNAAFVDIGDGLDAFLALNDKIRPHVSEGAIIYVAVKSPPRQGKGAVLKRLADTDLDRDKPGRLPPVHDAVLETVMEIGQGADEIIIDDGAASAVLKAAGLKADVRHETHSAALFERYDAEIALEEAFERSVPLKGGGRLVIDEAQALTAIDVDTAGLGASSPARLREKIAVAAANEAARQVVLRNIGGHVVIDFPSISAEAVRAQFRKHLDNVMKEIGGASAFGFSKSGLFSFTVPHHAQSLQERFTDTAPSQPSPGRRFTVEWRAKSAIRALEHRLRANPRAKLQLRLGSTLDAYISEHVLWVERLHDRYGARFLLVEDKTLEARSFDLSE